jgi:hypothetical protein
MSTPGDRRSHATRRGGGLAPLDRIVDDVRSCRAGRLRRALLGGHDDQVRAVRDRVHRREHVAEHRRHQLGAVGVPDRRVEALLGVAERLDRQYCGRAHERQTSQRGHAPKPRGQIALSPEREREVERLLRHTAASGGVGHRHVGRERRQRGGALVATSPASSPAYIAATPSLESGRPAQARSSSVGPFTERPPTSGETATTGARQERSAARIPVQGEDRADRDHGFEGPTITARASASASSTCAVGAAAAAPSNSTFSTGPAARSRISHSCSPHQRPPVMTRVRTGASLIGSTRAGTPSARRSASAAAVNVAPPARPARPRQADRQVPVAEVEPHVLAERAQRRHHLERVVAQSPATRIDAVGEPEGDEVGVGRDVAAVDLDVVARVGDHDQILADDVEHPAGELRASRPTREHDDRGRHRG